MCFDRNAIDLSQFGVEYYKSQSRVKDSDAGTCHITARLHSSCNHLGRIEMLLGTVSSVMRAFIVAQKRRVLRRFPQNYRLAPSYPYGRTRGFVQTAYTEKYRPSTGSDLTASEHSFPRGRARYITQIHIRIGERDDGEIELKSLDQRLNSPQKTKSVSDKSSRDTATPRNPLCARRTRISTRTTAGVRASSQPVPV